MAAAGGLNTLEEIKKAILDGSHPDIAADIQEMEANMKHRVARAEMHHKLQQDNLKANIDYELNAARDIFENQRRELQDQAISLVEARAKKMDAARNPPKQLSLGVEPRMTTRKMRSTNKYDPSDELSGGIEDKGADRGRRAGEERVDGIDYELEPEDILGDLRTIHREWSLNCEKFEGTRTSTVPVPVEVTARDGQLKYGNQMFKAKDPVAIRSSYTNEEFHGTIMAVKSDELRVQLIDGSKCRVYVVHLRNGRCSILPRTAEDYEMHD